VTETAFNYSSVNQQTFIAEVSRWPTNAHTTNNQPLDRLEDGIVNAVNLVARFPEKMNLLADAAKQDLSEFHDHRKLNIAKGLGAAAFIGANFLQVRALATPLQFDIAHATDPLVAGSFGAGIHILYYFAYSNTLRVSAANFKHTVGTIGRGFGIDKAPLPGLAPSSTTPPMNMHNPIKRLTKRIETRSKRAAVMQGTSTMAYIIAAALQEQPAKDQRKLCSETSIDGAISAFAKGFLLTGLVAVIGSKDKHLADAFYHFAKSSEGIASLSALPISIVGLSRVIKKIREHSKSKQEAEQSLLSINTVVQIPQLTS
jgi:hypothetical protein